MEESQQRMIKCIVVGDGTVGKTCMIIRYVTGIYPQDYIPTVYDNYSKHVQVDNRMLDLGVWDTAGQSTYANLRIISYPESDVVIICFAIDNRDSFEHVQSTWIQEVRAHLPIVPIILVGTKSDQRIDERPDCVSKQEATEYAERNDMIYAECSAMTDEESVNQVFDIATQLAMLAPKANPQRPCTCVLF